MPQACDRMRESLTLLALGEAVPEMEPELHAHLATCPACRADYASLRQTADRLALALPPVQPPAELKDRIMSAIRVEGVRDEEGAKEDSGPTPPIPGGKHDTIGTRTRGLFGRMRASVPGWAALLLAALMLSNAWFAVRAWDLREEERFLREAQAATVNRLQTAEQIMMTAYQSRPRIADLTPSDAAPGAQGTAVLYVSGEDPQTYHLYVTASGLDSVRDSGVYRVWIETAGGRDGQETIGEFQVDPRGFGGLVVESSEALEVTDLGVTLRREPNGPHDVVLTGRFPREEPEPAEDGLW